MKNYFNFFFFYFKFDLYHFIRFIVADKFEEFNFIKEEFFEDGGNRATILLHSLRSRRGNDDILEMSLWYSFDPIVKNFYSQRREWHLRLSFPSWVSFENFSPFSFFFSSYTLLALHAWRALIFNQHATYVLTFKHDI